VDVDFTVFKGLHNPLVDIHPDDFDSMRRKSTGGGQADISEADDADFVEVQDLLLEGG
jgi:hypothetical protein